MKYLIILLVSLFFVSCLGTKKTTETTTEVKENKITEVKTDSSNVEKINRSIDDEFLLSVRTNDSITNESIRQALKGFQQNKQSGSNSSSVRFDYEKLAFILKNSIGETKDTNTNTNKEEKIENTKETVMKEYIKKVMQVLPWWAYVIAFIVFLPSIIRWVKGIASIFYPVIGLLTKK